MGIHIKKLDQPGFDHVVGLLSFLVVFASIGTFYIVQSHAATAPQYVQLRLYNKNLCFTGENIATCSDSNREMLFVKPVGSNFQLKNAAGYCVDDWNHAYQSQPASKGGTRVNARLSACYSNDKNQQWSWKGHALANAGNNYKGCLNSAGAVAANNNPVIIYACNNAWNETWTTVSKTLNTSTTPTAPTWTLTGTTAVAKKSKGAVTFTNTLRNIGTKPTGKFTYGIRVMYSSSANIAPTTNGTYAGETKAGADVTYTSLKAGGSYSVSQPIAIPKTVSSGFVCETIAFSPRTSTGLTNGRSPAVCVSVASLR